MSPDQLRTIDWHGREPLPLRAGSHPDGSGACLREMVHYLATGQVGDAAPPCASLVLCALAPALTDSTAWESDAERERVLLPYAARLLDTAAPLEIEIARARALADEARVIVAELRERVGPATAAARAEWAAARAAAAVAVAATERAAAGDPRFTIAALSVRLLERGLSVTGGGAA